MRIIKTALLIGLAAAPRVTAQETTIELARRIAQNSGPYWTPLGSSVFRAKFRVGWGFAPGYAYLLLGSPSLLVSAATGGLPGVTTSIARAELLSIAESMLGSPRRSAQYIASACKEQGLNDYSVAYRIGKRLKEGQGISEMEAKEFLDKRWSIYRLEAAAELWSATISGETSKERMAKAETRVLVDRLIDQYLSRGLEIEKPLPVGKAAFFLADLLKLLRQSDDGLGAYAPYQKFTEQLAEIEERRKSEVGVTSASVGTTVVSPAVSSPPETSAVLVTSKRGQAMAAAPGGEANTATPAGSTRVPRSVRPPNIVAYEYKGIFELKRTGQPDVWAITAPFNVEGVRYLVQFMATDAQNQRRQWVQGLALSPGVERKFYRRLPSGTWNITIKYRVLVLKPKPRFVKSSAEIMHPITIP